MITIPTTELIGCIAETLPHISDPKHSAYAGLVLSWDGEALRFAAFDVYSGAEVTWVPGEGAEGDLDEDSDQGEDIAWGGADDPWRIFITYADAKEIVKLFKLPTALWRFPVKLKVNAVGTKLTVERDDMSRGERLLVLSTYNDTLKHIPSIEQVATQISRYQTTTYVDLPTARLAAFGAALRHGTTALFFGPSDEPVAVRIGSRVVGFVYRSGRKGFNMLRDGGGLLTRQPQESSVADPEGTF